MVIEPARVALKDWLRDICGSGDAALFAPESEAPQMLLASGDGLLRVVLHPHPFQMRRAQARHAARIGDVAHSELGLALSAPAHQRSPIAGYPRWGPAATCACLRFAATYDGAVS